MRLASLLPLLRARRSFCDVERRSRNPMSSLDQRRWWCDNRSLAAWLSLNADCQLALSAGAMIFAGLISAKCVRVCDALQPCHSLYASTVTDLFDFSRTSDILDVIAIGTLNPAGHGTSPGTIEGRNECDLPNNYRQTQSWYILNSSPCSTHKNLLRVVELHKIESLASCNFHPTCRLVFLGRR